MDTVIEQHLTWNVVGSMYTCIIMDRLLLALYSSPGTAYCRKDTRDTPWGSEPLVCHISIMKDTTNCNLWGIFGYFFLLFEVTEQNQLYIYCSCAKPGNIVTNLVMKILNKLTVFIVYFINDIKKYKNKTITLEMIRIRCRLPLLLWTLDCSICHLFFHHFIIQELTFPTSIIRTTDEDLNGTFPSTSHRCTNIE